ncbi:MAG TPA: hypothetical protein VN838_06825 [Bradyrhizobium sp.]|nr:hypothetical protein [Bradyrhizobium sp.]
MTSLLEFDLPSLDDDDDDFLAAPPPKPKKPRTAKAAPSGDPMEPADLETAPELGEVDSMRAGLVALSECFHPNGNFWRQNVGKAWMGHAFRLREPRTIPAGWVVIRNPRRISFGVPGQADVLGVLDGRFVSLEWKREGHKPGKDQEAWQKTVSVAGGLAGTVTSPEEAIAFLRDSVGSGK